MLYIVITGNVNSVAIQHPLSLQEFIWALSAFCQLNRIPFDANLVAKHYPPPYSSSQLEIALRGYGFSSALRQASLAELKKVSLPCLAILKPEPVGAEKADADAVDDPDSSQSQQTSCTSQLAANVDLDVDMSEQAPEQVDGRGAELPPQPKPLALILSIDHEQNRVLVLSQNQAQPETLNMAELTERLTGDFIFVRKMEETVAGDEAGLSANTLAGKQKNEQKEFGFKWFVPKLLKYKKIWSEVLIASLAIQLVGLAVPICTQVIIDKVIVHHTFSTLTVIGIALFMFLTFSSVMGWVRQYLVLHTGSRIDATLGHKVFSHLLDLPVRYYDSRPTGVVIARVQGGGDYSRVSC